MSDRFNLEHLRRRVDGNPASIAFAALAEEYRRAGLLDEAIETCRRGLTRHPAYVSARVTLGSALLEAERLDEAEEEFSRVLQLAPENLAAIRQLALIEGLRTGEMTPRPRRRPTDERQIEALGGLLAAIHQARTTVRSAH